MSAEIKPLTLKLSRERVPVHQVSPFEDFTRTRNLSVHDTQKFYLYVVSTGGSLATDILTLSILFDLWEEKGRP